MTESEVGSPENNTAAKASEKSIFSRLMSVLSSGWVARYILAITITALAFLPLVDNLYGNLLIGRYAKVSRQLADKASTQFNKAQILLAFRTYGLAWYYIEDGGTLEQATIPYAPPVLRLAKKDSDFIEIKGSEFYDSVAPMSGGRNLHVGFYMGNLGLSNNLDETLILRTIPVGYGLLLLISALTAIGLIESIFVSRPLEKIAQASRHLITGDDHEVRSALSVNAVAPSISTLTANLKAVREDYNREVYDRIKREHELKKQAQDLEKEREQLLSEYREHQFNTTRDISEMASKEAEDELLKALGKELDRLDTVGAIGQAVLDRLANKYTQSIRSGVYVNIDKQNRLSIPAFIGLDDKALHTLKGINFEQVMDNIFGRRSHLFLPRADYGRYGLAQVELLQQFESIAFLPILFENRKLGFLMVPLTAIASNLHEKARVLKNITELTSRSIFRVNVLQEELESARTDPLTGLYNKKFLYELVPKLTDRAGVTPEDHPITFIMIDGDHFKDINDNYGHVVGDQLLRELAEVIRTHTRMNEGQTGSGRYKDYVIRYGGEEILVVLENTSPQNAKVVATRIKQAVEEKDNWPGGIAAFSVSVGMASFPENSRNFEEILKKADTALYFVKEQMGRNNICAWDDVPQSYRAKLQSSTVGGELGVFDPPGLLQSIASTQKTGVLTVKSGDERQFWILFDEGRAVQARLGKHRGFNAVVEFIATFKDGNFQFQERNKSGTGKLPRLNDAFNLEKGLDRMLMDGVLALDNMSRAMKVLPDMQVILVPLPPGDLARALEAARTSPEPPHESEVKVVKQMLEFCSLDTTLLELFAIMDDVPTPVLWHCAGLIVTHNLARIEVPQVDQWLGKLGSKV